MSAEASFSTDTPDYATYTAGIPHAIRSRLFAAEAALLNAAPRLHHEARKSSSPS